jgi:uncharacterized protein (DUF1697 family)
MTHIALLRAINVGGHKPVAMADLRDLLSELGFGDPRSLLQSGNLVFDAGRLKGPALERLLEQKAAQRFNHHTDIMVRTAAELKTVVRRNPFHDQAERDPGHLVVVFLKSAPGRRAYDALRAAISGPELVYGDGRQAYVIYPAGIGRSRLTNAVIERKLATRGTARNWNTVMKLAALIGV